MLIPSATVHSLPLNLPFVNMKTPKKHEKSEKSFKMGMGNKPLVLHFF